MHDNLPAPGRRMRACVARFAGVLALWLAAGAAASAWAATALWIEPRSNALLDRQTVEILAPHAGLVVLRAPFEHELPEYALPAVVSRIKQATPAPVLAYAWGTRHRRNGRSEADILRGLNVGKPLLTVRDRNDSTVQFLDVTDPDLRHRVVNRFVEARRALGVDGFAIDLSTRTPLQRPAVLARMCQAKATFCGDYAQGMDALFAELRQRLGPRSTIAYNGLFNFHPGQLDDQLLLLRSANAAAIEYFGLDPNEPAHSFTQHILPFLKVMQRAPRDSTILVFGRGPWRYTDYAADYLWQRYLYASFLLAARPQDLFKYHASFQVPAHNGRAGGMDLYADGELQLGEPVGAATEEDGLYKRSFARGMVVVAPDDGRGGRLTLPRPLYTPEGAELRGEVSLAAGQALILLARREDLPARPDTLVIDAARVASFGWPQARREGQTVRLDRIEDPALRGMHDVLLDAVRSPAPWQVLELDATRLDARATLQLVAEVDDPRREHDTVVVTIGGAPRAAGSAVFVEPVLYRSTNPRRAEAALAKERWPELSVDAPPPGRPLVIDGAELMARNGYHFRRWSHLRMEGPVAFSRLTLRKPRRVEGI